jgi:hypothetical protein
MINKILGAMLGWNINLEDTKSYAESRGYYDRIPIRVGSFVLKENEKDNIVFYTTSKDFCRDGPEVIVSIKNGDNGWVVKQRQGAYSSRITPSVDLSQERLERRRALWHAKEYMIGTEMNYKERFSLSRQQEEEADLFEDDAFFRGGNAITSDPFSEFLD